MQNISSPREQAILSALKNAEDILCKCGSSVFSQGSKLKKLSRILTGEPEDAIVPIPVVYCIKCNTILEKGGIDNNDSSSLITS